MTDLNFSFELLSTMSPKISKNKKKFKKSPTKLSLKKHLRKSAIFDKKSYADPILNNSVILIEDSPDKDCSPKNCKLFKTPVVVSSTSESDAPANDGKCDLVLNITEKFMDIENWLTENEKVNGYSEVYSFRNNSMSNSFEEKSPKSIENMDEDTGQTACSWEVVSIESKTGKEPLRNEIPDFGESNCTYSKNKIQDDEINQYKEIVDLYSTPIRKNKFSINSDVIPSDNSNSMRGSKTEPKLRKIISEKPQNLLREVQMKSTNLGIKSSQTHRRINSWDSGSENESIHSSVSCKSTDGLSDNCKKISFSESEDEQDSSFSDLDKASKNILDDLYGTLWRENKSKITPRSEPRLTKKNNLQRLIKTERKSRAKTKEDTSSKQRDFSKVQLKSTKSVTQSPWYQRIADLCDSDTESNTSTGSDSELLKNSDSYKDLLNNRKKLSFDDSDDEDENFDVGLVAPKNKKTVVTKNLKSQSLYDTHLNESDDESLETKILKKYVNVNENTKQIVSNFKISDVSNKNNKTTIENNDNKDMKYTDKNVDEKINGNRIGKDESKIQRCSFLKSLSTSVPSWLSNLEAKFYRENYKTHKTVLAQKLFNMYNERIFDKAIPEDTLLEWNDRMRGTAGFCYNKKKIKMNGEVERSCRIVLSTKVLDTADRLRDTLLHEMCHAATWIVQKVADGHGPYWKSWTCKAIQIFPDLPPVTRCHNYTINTKYTYKCVNCGYSIGRHSKSLDIERKRCGYCYGKFEIFINKIKKNGEKESTPAKAKGKPNPFAEYVKQNYSAVKKSNKKHGEIMKILGQQFAALKLAQNET